MELKSYFVILMKKWWIVLPTFIVTLTAGIVFTYTRTPVYNATATYLVVPSTAFSDVQSFASGLDILGRRDEIATTFSAIGESRSLKILALEQLGIGLDLGYSVKSKLRAGTNVIEFTVEGPDPIIVRELANSVGKFTEEYVQGLYEVFIILPLDEATIPVSPSSPNIPLNLVLSAVVGLVLGAGLAFLSTYLETPLSSTVSVNVIDAQTGVYNKEYFLRRLGEEMVRAKRNHYPLSVALMRIDNLTLLKGTDSLKVRIEALRQVAVLASQYLREEDVVAYIDDDTFGIILPDMHGENAKALMEYIQTRVAWTPFAASNNSIKMNLAGVVGIVAYNYNGTSRNELIDQAYQALQMAEVNEDGRVYLASIVSSAKDNYAQENITA